jgi:uncharacterized repeat protein (TIGR02059 family)
MATTPLQITIVAGTLPSGAVYNPQTYFNAIVARMSASISSGNVVFGQLGGTQPAGPLPGVNGQAGLWFGSPTVGGHGYWNDWNTDAAVYLPIPMLCGQYVNSVLRTTNFVCGAVTANQTITTPDKSGMMALISDIPQALGTQTLQGSGTQTVDWTEPNPPIYIVMTGNMTINNINMQDGMITDFWLENASQNSATRYTIVFTPAVEWPIGESQLTGLSAGASGLRVVDHIRVHRTAGYSFGEVVSHNHQIAVGADNTLPAPVSAAATDANTIGITMNAVLQGNNALGTADFAVLVNGTADPVTSASCSGSTVLVNLTNNMPKASTVTVKYTGADMKSVAGNVVPAFGPISVNVGALSGGGGIHNDMVPKGGVPP